jgi:hypothetical protein
MSSVNKIRIYLKKTSGPTGCQKVPVTVGTFVDFKDICLVALNT